MQHFIFKTDVYAVSKEAAALHMRRDIDNALSSGVHPVLLLECGQKARRPPVTPPGHLFYAVRGHSPRKGLNKGQRLGGVMLHHDGSVWIRAAAMPEDKSGYDARAVRRVCRDNIALVAGMRCVGRPMPWTGVPASRLLEFRQAWGTMMHYDLATVSLYGYPPHMCEYGCTLTDYEQYLVRMSWLEAVPGPAPVPVPPVA